jgi:metallophosphoesterase superfamily enzyme
MQFDYINDVHLDLWVPLDNNPIKMKQKVIDFTKTLLPEIPSKVLVIGGDLGHYNHQNVLFLEELTKTYTYILLVFGNHDYYMISNRQEKKYKMNSMNKVNEMKELVNHLNNVIYLEGNTIEIDSVVIGGTGMWYDFSYGQKEHGNSYDDVWLKWAKISRDHKRIKGISILEKFNYELEKMNSVIENCDVVISHMGPDWSLSPYEEDEKDYNSFYFFDGKELLEKFSNKIWCFGHVHIKEDIQKNGWRMISHGLGYPDEKGFVKFKQVKL